MTGGCIPTAETIFIIYGTASLSIGFVLGIPLSQERMRGPEASRHLVTAHLSAIIQGAVHLALSLSIGFAALTPWLETAAAVLLAMGSALFVAGAVLNWRQGIGDHFAARSLGWKFLSASSFGHMPGMLIVFVGVVMAA